MCTSRRELSGEFACYFPFLEKSARFLASLGLTLDVALEDKTIVNAAVARLQRALARQFPKVKRCLDKPEEEAAAARLALYMAASTKNVYILRKFADFESKYFRFLLRRIPSVQNPSCLVEIAYDLSIVAKPTAEIAPGLINLFYPMAVRWSAYLKYAPQDPHWAMINRPVVRGWVAVARNEFERILEEAYRHRMLKIAEESELAVGKVATVVDLSQFKAERYTPIEKRSSGGSNPPCMTAIMNALKAGEGVPHTARFAIAAYLVKRGWDVDQIVDLFRTAPDFNEKITRYQVQHIAGQAGGRKEYSVPSCETMATWGLCVARCGVKNPLQYGVVKKSN